MSIVEHSPPLSLNEARSILGDDVLGPEEVSQAFGVAPTELEMRDSVHARGADRRSAVWRDAGVAGGAR